MNKILFALISIIFFSYCDTNCDKLIEYKFQIPLTLTPAQDTFSIGDTIWIGTSFFDEMLDLNSNHKYPLVDFDFFTKFSFFQIDINPFEDADIYFEIVTKEGEVDLIPLGNSSSILKINYVYQDNIYKARFGFIPKKSGLFNFGSSSSHTLGFENKIDLSSCKGERVEFIYKMNDGIDNNYEFITLSPDSLTRTLTKDVFDEYASYNFYVVN